MGGTGVGVAGNGGYPYYGYGGYPYVVEAGVVSGSESGKRRYYASRRSLWIRSGSFLTIARQ